MPLSGKTAQWDGERHRAAHVAALTSEAAWGYGWRHQAEHLAFAHTTLGIAAITVAGQARRRSSLKQATRRFQTVDAELEPGPQTNTGEFAEKLRPTRPALAKPEQPGSRETTDARMHSDQIGMMVPQTEVSDNGGEEPGDELGSAREELVHCKNENHSLQTSLDLIAGENARLSRHLRENDAAASDKRVAALEGELASARERLVLLENENNSLQTSIDFFVRENARLSRRLLDDDAAASDKKVVELEGELASAREQLVLRDNELALRESENRSLRLSVDLFDRENSRLSLCLMKTDTAVAKRLAELETGLASAREDLGVLQGENRSLKTQLDLSENANSRVSSSLTESEAATDRARSQVEQMRLALIAAETKLTKLALVVDEANAERPAETKAPETHLEAVSSDAAAMEKLLAETRQNCLDLIEQNGVAQLRIANATERDNRAEKKIELFRILLQVKEHQVRKLERQVQHLEQSRSMLIGDANMILKTFTMRDAALVRAGERIRLLVQRVAELEAEASVGQKEIEIFNSPLQCERMERVIAENAGNMARVNCAPPGDDYTRHNGEHEPVRVRSAEDLLAGTVTFLNAA